MSVGLGPLTPTEPDGSHTKSSLSSYLKYVWVCLLYTILVILWGAVVRATGAGDGCGAHWPLCNGEVIPTTSEAKTWFEFGHRITSGVVLPLLIGLAIWTYRIFPKGHQARLASIIAIIFTLTEAFIGMGLVKLELTGENDSVQRAYALAMHLLNTFILLSALVMVLHFALRGAQIRLRNQGPLLWALGMCLVGVLFLGMSGAVTALGDTLFPGRSIRESLEQALTPTNHVFIQLRIYHPLIATSIGVLLVLAVGWVGNRMQSKHLRWLGGWVIAMYAAGMLSGVVNIFLKAPVWMQVVHLALADALWIALMMFCLYALAIPKRQQEAEPVAGIDSSESLSLADLEATQEEREPVVARRTFKQVVGEYVLLTKPRVISLLLFTTLAAMFAAAGGWPGGWLLFWVAIGGYMAAGAANAINMVIDRDIDRNMKRTAKRPTVTRNISSAQALTFAGILAVGSCTILTLAANWLAAAMAMAGLAFYVLIYTLLLKRRTWHNIVIGGAAGSFPPLVGWAAVTGSLSPMAWMLFILIFMWTPVHFWALAIMIKDDYRDAGIPMAPVVLGDRMTVIQIGLYAVLTAMVTLIPLWAGQVGWLYLIGVGFLNLLLIIRCVQLWKAIDRPHALRLYKYSMAYLALFFILFAADQAMQRPL
ncbi:MAG: heme o synthase [Fimbriimonadaceae bacterium]